MEPIHYPDSELFSTEELQQLFLFMTKLVTHGFADYKEMKRYDAMVEKIARMGQQQPPPYQHLVMENKRKDEEIRDLRVQLAEQTEASDAA